MNWQPPAHWLRVSSIDMHTAGEPLRVLLSGLPPVEGNTVLEKRRYFREHYDHLRTGVIWEPRGHSDMYAAVLSRSRDADFDVFFLHNEGYSTMCGHAIIALTTLVIETGLTERDGRDGRVAVSFNVPAGRIEAHARVEAGRARDVAFRNVPSFLYSADQVVEVPGIGRVRFDIAYGGAFYAFVEAASLGLELTPPHANRLIDYGRRIKLAVMDAIPVRHPFEPELGFLYGTIFTGRPRDASHHSRNVCIFADGELDRSPTGSGVSARAAIHYAKGEVSVNQRIEIESIVDSTMTVQVVASAKFGPHDAVVPEVGGTAYVTGRSEWCFDPDDPYRAGFLLR